MTRITSAPPPLTRVGNLFWSTEVAIPLTFNARTGRIQTALSTCSALKKETKMVKMATATISRGNDGPRITDFIDMVDFPDAKLRTFRPVGDIVIQRTHWINILSKEGKKVRLPITCIAYDLENNPREGVRCAFCEVNHASRPTYYWNVIDSKLVTTQPRRLPPLSRKEQRTGFKEKGSDSWTPIRVWAFPTTAAETVQQLTQSNKNKRDEMKELSDPVFGRAIDVSKNTNAASPANYWNVQRADQQWRRLDEGELQYLKYDLTLLNKLMLTEKAQDARLRNLIPSLDPEAQDFEELDLSEYADLVAKNRHIKGNDVDDDDSDDAEEKRGRRGSFSIKGRSGDDDDMPKRKRSRDDSDADDDDTDTIQRRRPSRDERPARREREEPRRSAKRPEREERPMRREREERRGAPSAKRRPAR